MSIVVNTNVSSLMVQQNLSNATSKINQSLERLSTGYKINSAADDAAGLTISQGLTSQSNGDSVASTNAQTGVNLLQTAESDLGIIQENLQRIRDLTVQAANGTYGSSERSAIKAEVGQRIQEISRIANSSSFNSIKLLNGTCSNLSLQIGANYVANQLSLNSLNIGAGLAGATATQLGLCTGPQSLDISYATSASSASYISKIDAAITTVSSRRSTIGSIENRLQSAIQSLTTQRQNVDSANSLIMDTNIAQETSNLTKNQILQQASSSLLSQANQEPQLALSLLKGS